MEVEEILKNLTLEQKVRQMFMFNLPGKQLDAEIFNLIKKYHIGNLILFTINLGNGKEIKKLTSDFQEYSLKEFGFPAFISSDMEGGNVERYSEDIPRFPGAAAIVSTNSIANCQDLSESVAKVLLSLGINMNLAPVCDINDNSRNPVIGARSFGFDPQKISNYIKAHINGHKKAGCLTCAKHFPGHGSTFQDSHRELPHIIHKYDEFMKKDIPPFKDAIEAGVDSIMTAHLLSPLDEENPASLSPKVINYIRKELGFDGLLVTDSLVMKGVSIQGIDVAVRKAILAGNNILIANTMEGDFAEFYKMIEGVLNDVKSGVIPEQLIDDSCRRIISSKLKLKHALETNKYDENEEIYISNLKKLSNEISQNSIAVPRDENGLIPFNGRKVVCVYTKLPQKNVSFEFKLIPSFADVLKEANNDESNPSRASCLEIVNISKNPTEEEIKQSIDASKAADIVVFAPFRPGLNTKQLDLLNEIQKVNTNVIFVSSFDPYEVNIIPHVFSIIVGFELTSLSIHSTVNCLIGRCPITGHFDLNL
ncbi:glycosyl hydrolase family 3 N terminal domain-containing protein [Trichomonas vaginalis G3]|uniref:glycosyl hydrolase n=1 Tax=Trichomonas vaginalis (strain ATCC PRA-98 / G3) TaxID=412133 RepID=UPI0021E59DFA|nr:glycosyl hydrolase [Trichomonas vaginalis G3]KAI5507529.1 glycosyl hydrolase family 3 N terminal domain-containing protein [Trichomonas vaginalis G3]